MGRDITTPITPAPIEAYLRQHGHPDARVISLTPLGGDTRSGLKGYGYGRPLHIIFDAAGARHQRVLRTMSPDPFAHDRRADRADVLLLAYDTFNTIPRHIRALDVGAFTREGKLVSMAEGEVFLLTDYVDGALYADDLHAAQGQAHATPRDLDRAGALARYLAELHAEPADPARWTRCLRDTIGSGEGIFGLCDNYPAHHAIATRERLLALEKRAVEWRWHLRDRSHRACRTHGDFHPFNILFRDATDFSVLDCSRGAAGEAADDLAALTINYLFFALDHDGSFTGALREIWNAFWHAWLAATGDREAFEVIAPFFAWRGLVVASPVWYPTVPDATRHTLLRFVERLLDGLVFDPFDLDPLLAP